MIVKNSVASSLQLKIMASVKRGKFGERKSESVNLFQEKFKETFLQKLSQKNVFDSINKNEENKPNNDIKGLFMNLIRDHGQ
jgi:hypothetical protein